MKKLNWKAVFHDCWKDMVAGIGLSLCLLLMDGRIALFLVTLAMSVAVSFGLAIYRQKKFSSDEDDCKRMEFVARFGIVLYHSSSLESCIEEMDGQGFGNSELLDLIRRNELDSLCSYGKSGNIVKTMIDAFNNGNKEEIGNLVSDAVRIKKRQTVEMSEMVDSRTLGVILAVMVSLVGCLMNGVTVVKEAVSNMDWVSLVVRLLALCLFVWVEFAGSSKKKGKESTR